MRVDVRIVDATHDDLPGLVEAEGFGTNPLDRLSFGVVALVRCGWAEGEFAVLTDHYDRRMAGACGWTDAPGVGEETLTQMAADR